MRNGVGWQRRIAFSSMLTTKRAAYFSVFSIPAAAILRDAFPVCARCCRVDVQFPCHVRRLPVGVVVREMIGRPAERHKLASGGFPALERLGHASQGLQCLLLCALVTASVGIAVDEWHMLVN